MGRRIVRLLLALMAIPLFSSAVHSQTVSWHKIGQLGIGIECGFFWNRNEGVVATNSRQFYYLKDGKGWRAGLQLRSGSSINSIRCFDGKTLYAAVDFQQLWKSTDSGVTWSYVPSAPATNPSPGIDVFWNYTTNAPVLRGSIVARLDSLDLISTMDDCDATPYFSHDGGRSWINSKFIAPRSYHFFYAGLGACADLTNKLYYAAGEAGAPEIARSKDTGRTWTPLTSLPQNLFMVDDVEGIYDKTFIQTSKGLYETTVSGNTWNSIGGPSRQNSDDALFCVMGCTGQAVVAFDDGGGIWIANAWDAPDPAELNSTFSATPKECDTSTIIVIAARNFEPGRLLISIQNDSSDAFTLLSSDTIQLDSSSGEIRIRFIGTDLAKHTATLTITPLDYGLCPITHPIWGQAYLRPPIIKAISPVVVCSAGTSEIYLSDLDCDSLHITSISSSPAITVLPFDSTISGLDSILLSILPAGKDTTEQDTIVLRGIREPSGIAFDTSVRILVKTSHIRSTLGWPSLSQLRYVQENTCDPIDTSIILWNNGCDTIEVDLSPSDTSSGGWTISSKTGMHVLYPGQADTIHILFFSPIHGNYNLTLGYEYRYGVSLRGIVDFDLLVTVPNASANLFLSPTSVDLGTRPICLADTTFSILLQNLRCDSMIVSDVHFLNRNAFLLLPATDTVLPPGGELNETIIYSPTQRGIDQDSLAMHISNTNNTFSTDSSIFCIVNVTRGTANLTSSATAFDLGKTSICEERDTFAVIQDSGCDSVCISDVSVAGTGFIITSNGGAFCLAPNESDTVWLRTQVDTTGELASNNALLTVTSDAIPPLAPITLSREIEYPVPWELRLSPPDSANAGQKVIYRVIQKGTLPPDDTSVDFVLVFYDDLLRVDGVDEAWTHIWGHYRDADGQAHYHFHISMPVGDSIIATIDLTAYQARMLSTQISLDSIQFSSSPSRPSDCIAIASVTNSEFTIRTSCGGPLLSQILNGALAIDGISPNPTTGEVLLRYTLRGASVNGIIEI